MGRHVHAGCVLALAAITCLSAEPLREAGPRELRKASHYVMRGERAFQAGHLDKASDFYERALKVVPDFPDARMGLGHVAMVQGRFENALVHYRAAEAGYGRVHDALLSKDMERYSAAQLKIRRLEDAIRALNSPMLRLPEPIRRLKTLELERQIEQLEAMDYPDRERDFGAPPQLYFHMGNALFRLGRDDEAVAAWERCVALDPDFPLVHNNLAVAYMRQGRLREARERIERARSLGLQVNPAFLRDLENRERQARLQARP